MDKNFLIQLTHRLYRLTLLFPKKEPLRYKIREVADEILVNSLRITNKSNPSKKTENCSRQILEELEVLDGFFEIAKYQNWVSPFDILEIQKEYCKTKEGLEQFLEKLPELETLKVEKRGRPAVKSVEKTGKILISGRQEKILAFLKENGRAQVWEIKPIFPEVTKRTIRRDFEYLLKQGKIERMGERNEIFYQIKYS